jgi:peroxygenase
MITPLRIHSPIQPAAPPPSAAPANPTAPALPQDVVTVSGKAEPKRSKLRSLAAAVALTLAGVGIVSSMVPPAPVSISAPRTTLQKHVDYFDRNHDGQVQIGETYQGLRAMNVGVAQSAFGALAINGALGPKTSTTWWQPTTINTARINFAKHGSDTGIIGPDGQFVQQKFDEMFAKWDPQGKGYITESQLEAMRAANKTDAAGAIGSKAEFNLLLDLAGQQRLVDGQPTRVLTRETMQDLYNGTLFYRLAGEPAPQQ